MTKRSPETKTYSVKRLFRNICSFNFLIRTSLALLHYD